MPFIQDILNYRSVSIVGLEKNTGKTECLNYILNRLPLSEVCVAVTSIGLDGESLDQVTSTVKPEIIIREGMVFATSEKHYKQRKVLSELFQVSDETTALGRVVTAKALSNGKVLLSGPSSGSALKRWMDTLEQFNIDLIIVDGALSRLSTASPAISEAMILSTGAALSANIRELVSKTAFIVDMINLPLCIDGEVDVMISSFVDFNGDILKGCRRIGLEGALTDRLLNMVRNELSNGNIELVVNDFTKIFISSASYRSFIKRGGRISVRMRSKLIAVCVNPISPSGYVLDSDTLCGVLSEVINLPVYDIVKNNYIN
jgi:hypothetical protein